MREESRRWLKQAEADREAARSLGAGHYHMGAFACHQAVKKAMRAAFIELRRSLAPKTHNLLELARELNAPEEVLSDLRLLNPEYAVSRLSRRGHRDPGRDVRRAEDQTPVGGGGEDVAMGHLGVDGGGLDRFLTPGAGPLSAAGGDHLRLPGERGRSDPQRRCRRPA
ncbi:MAG: HEPN domain-containing protein [bacterium]|nr:HEPN domain-containing protein [bacterium]